MTAMEVHMSKIKATAPPCKLPPALQRERGTVREKVANPSPAVRGFMWLRRHASKYYFVSRNQKSATYFSAVDVW
jgi:hypothetical protein